MIQSYVQITQSTGTEDKPLTVSAEWRNELAQPKIQAHNAANEMLKQKIQYAPSKINNNRGWRFGPLHVCISVVWKEDRNTTLWNKWGLCLVWIKLGGITFKLSLVHIWMLIIF